MTVELAVRLESQPVEVDYRGWISADVDLGGGESVSTPGLEINARDVSCGLRGPGRRPGEGVAENAQRLQLGGIFPL
jgi:hypothetical protein